MRDPDSQRWIVLVYTAPVWENQDRRAAMRNGHVAVWTHCCGCVPAADNRKTFIMLQAWRETERKAVLLLLISEKDSRLHQGDSAADIA